MNDTAHHPELFLETPLGCIWPGDSLAVMRGMGAGSVDLVMTSPPFALTRKEWVNVRRIRVKDAVNTVWWLSKTEWPKAANRRVLQPYSPSMEQLLAKGYRAKLRPSGHDISANFGRNNGAAIPPNLLAIPNTESNSAYMRYCKDRGIKPHPARFPADLPEYFIRMLTDPGDLVFDPFGGSCITGEVAERLGRRWVCAELSGDYLEGARGRFPERGGVQPRPMPKDDGYYRLPRPSLLWNGPDPERLDPDGGRKRPAGVRANGWAKAGVAEPAARARGGSAVDRASPMPLAARGAEGGTEEV
jgi:site-specific DNA-methyltransferase (cytosine-N4-specific)